MGHYLDGEDGKVFVKMYRGRAVGISFPTDGNRYNEEWHRVFDQYGVKVEMHLGDKGPELVCVEVDLPESIIGMETSLR